MTSMEFNHKLISLENNMERYALSLTFDREKAKDLLQDTYFKALTNKDKYVEVSNFKAWAFTIMKNTFINNYRKSVRENGIFEKNKDLFLFNISKESDIGMPESELACKEVYDAIETLDDHIKVPFRMHADGYKYKEIAEALNLNIGTVKSRIFLFRKKLMEAIQESR